MSSSTTLPSFRRTARRRGAALILALFVMTMTTLVSIAVLETQLAQMTALRHSSDYEKALYLAGAGVHHALAELEADASWRTGVPATEFPVGSGKTYSATAVDGSSGDVVVTGEGTCGSVTRRLQVTVSLSG